MKQPKRSYVWMYCEQLSPKLVQCKLCGGHFKYHSSTTALRSHLQTKHPEEAANDTYVGKPIKAERRPSVSHKSTHDEEDEDYGNGEDQSDITWTPQRKTMRPRKYKRKSYAEDISSDIDEVEDVKPIVVPQTINGVSKKRSIIWHFMVKISPSECTCALCDKVFNVKQGSTTNMMKHLEVTHPEELEEVKRERGLNSHPAATPSLKQNFKPKPKKLQLAAAKLKVAAARKQQQQQQQSRAPDFLNSKKSLPYLVNMLVKDLQPFCTVESESFQKLVKVLNPRISLPSQEEIKSNIVELHRKYRTLCQAEIDEAPGISLTTEIWTYRERREYLTVTGHFVSQDWELQSVVLKTVLLDTRNVAELNTNIAYVIDQIMKEWKIADKVTCIVTDPTEALATAVAQVKKPHLMCIAHALNLIVETSLKESICLENLAERIRDIVDFVDHSPEVSRKLYGSHISKLGEIHTRPLDIQVPRREETQAPQPDEMHMADNGNFQVLKPVDFQAINPDESQAPGSNNFQTLKAVEFQTLKPVEFQPPIPQEFQPPRPQEFQAFKPYETQADNPGEFQISRPDETQAQNLQESQAPNSDESQPKRTDIVLTLDTELNWMSTYNMFKNYSELHCTLRSILQEMNREYILLRPNELELLNQCLQILRPFALAVEDMTSDVYTARSKSLPVFEILEQMVSSKTSADTDVDPLAALSAELNAQLGEVMRTSVRNKANLLSFTSTLLDPRFKQIVLKESDMLVDVEAKVQEMMGEGEPVDAENLNNTTTSDFDPDSLWSSFDLTVKRSVKESPVNELHRYLEESPVRRLESPLEYWREREVLYPKLVSIVKTFLSIPATSVPPKQIFSAEEKSKMIRRTFLEEDHLDSILFLSSCQVDL